MPAGMTDRRWRSSNNEGDIPRFADPHGLTMKLPALVLFTAVIGSTSLSAAVEQCRFINSRPDREACYDRQEKALAAKRKPEPVEDTKTRSVDDIEMKMENDRLRNSLRSICRGC
jgi:hypothetical protein